MNIPTRSYTIQEVDEMVNHYRSEGEMPESAEDDPKKLNASLDRSRWWENIPG